MKFTVNRLAFISYLNDVQRAISSKVAIEVLKGIKLTLSADALKLTGSDVDITIETIISIGDDNAALQVEEEGSVILPANFFINIVKKLPEAALTLEVNERFQATITSGVSEFKINGLNPEDFPQLPEIDTDDQFILPADTLKQVISQTVVAVSNQEMRPILTGVHLVIRDQQLLAVATDSHRLSQRKISLANIGAHLAYDVIIPGRSLGELGKMLADDEEEVVIQISQNQVLFTFGHTSYYSRLLEGMYPDTEQLIPQTSNTDILFDAVEMLRSIERASLLSHAGHNNVVKLSLKVAEQKATLSGNSPEIGMVEEDLAFNSLTGNDLEISFNPDYMKDALRSFGKAEIKMSFTQPLRPFTLVPSEDGNDFVQLITPVRTF